MVINYEISITSASCVDTDAVYTNQYMITYITLTSWHGIRKWIKLSNEYQWWNGSNDLTKCPRPCQTSILMTCCVNSTACTLLLYDQSFWILHNVDTRMPLSYKRIIYGRLYEYHDITHSNQQCSNWWMELWVNLTLCSQQNTVNPEEYL